jgi:hypothetical protein
MLSKPLVLDLLRAETTTIFAVSPDAVCVFECSTVGLAANDESKLVRDVRKLCSFLSTTNGLVERKDENDDGDVFNFMATMEYKHKSETATQQEARKIVSQVLNGSKVVVLDLTLQNDVLLFQAAIPNVDYVDWERCVTRKQLMTARKYHGKPFVEFLKKLFHTVEMPTILRGSGTAHMDDALSPPRTIPRTGKVTYENWAKEDEWVQFRTTKNTQAMYLPKSRPWSSSSSLVAVPEKGREKIRSVKRAMSMVGTS